VGVFGWHWHPHTKIKQIFQKLKNTIASFKKLLYYNNWNKRSTKPGERAVGMSINKEDFERLIEKLTEEQKEYIYYLIMGLFCQAAD